MALQSAVGRSGNATQGLSNQPHNLLFGTESQTNLSVVVTVDDDPVVIRAFNLEANDIVLVEMVWGSGAGDIFAPFSPRGVQETLSVNRNVLPIGMAGRYRFTLQTTDNTPPPIGQVIVTCNIVVMSQEWIMAYLTPLNCPS